MAGSGRFGSKSEYKFMLNSDSSVNSAVLFCTQLLAFSVYSDPDLSNFSRMRAALPCAKLFGTKFAVVWCQPGQLWYQGVGTQTPGLGPYTPNGPGWGKGVIQPVTSITGSQFTPGKQLEFRIRSSASRWLNWRETKLMVRYKVAFTLSTFWTRYRGIGFRRTHTKRSRSVSSA
eukprot:COSAG02_NODE_4125_length_5743_cov_5.905741_2_plen_174_part_00